MVNKTIVGGLQPYALDEKLGPAARPAEDEGSPASSEEDNAFGSAYFLISGNTSPVRTRP